MPLIAPNLPGLPSPLEPDVLTQRPYFLVPFGNDLSGANKTVSKEAQDREEVDKQLAGLAKQANQISDIFILCHGWHRNLCEGVSAYDRLMSRFGLLVSRGRIKLVDKSGKAINPLFLAIHWNSDPEHDAWVDNAGRRDKASFLSQVRAAFDPTGSPPGGFLRDMENAFEIMSQVSAPDNGLPQPPPPAASIAALASRVATYQVRDAVLKMTAQEKVCTLWRCYFEATPMAFLQTQDEKPEPVGSPLTAFSTVIKFILGVVGVAFLVPAVLGPFWKWVGFPTTDLKAAFANLAEYLPPWQQHYPHWDGCKCLTALAVCLVCFVALGVSSLWRTSRGKSGAGTGVPFQAILWLPVQIVVSLPVITFLLFTYLLRFPLALVILVVAGLGWYLPAAWLLVLFALAACAFIAFDWPLSGVFREKLKAPMDRARNARDALVVPARYLIKLLKDSVGDDSAVFRAACAIDNQFAFFAMQRRGVSVGAELGDWMFNTLAPMFAKQGENAQPIRVHFIGHSFGTLVITNAQRTFAQLCASDGRLYKSALRNLFYFASRHADPFVGPTRSATPSANMVTTQDSPAAPVKPFSARYVEVKPPARDTGLAGVRSFTEQDNIARHANARNLCRTLKTHSLILIEGAIASDWFRGENASVDVTGALANIYSVYDTANGFYYPFANNGRMAAGFVGLCKLPVPPVKVQTTGIGPEFALLVKPPILPIAAPAPYYLNIDASRLIYNGAVAAGGGHDDIFKDDVVNLIWSVVSL